MPLKTLLLLLLLSACIRAGAQNLVPNPSFEEYSICPNSENQVQYCLNWNKNCISTPDYFNACSVQFGVPQNQFGYQYAATGNAYCGLYTFAPGIHNYREYIGTKLITPLILNKKYFITLKVCLIEGANCYSNNIGMLFSKTAYYYNYLSNPFSINNFAQCNNLILISDSINWTVLKYNFIADSAYQYISIGNFFGDSITSYFTNDSIYCNAYYFIDDICVSLDSMTCENGFTINNYNISEKIKICPNPVNDFLYVENNTQTKIKCCNIFNYYGKLIKQINNINDNEKFDLSDFSSGLYLFQFKTEKIIVNKKIVINKMSN